jgi:hypothetical protein
MTHEDEIKMASQGIGGQRIVEANKRMEGMLEASRMNRRRWFMCVSQRLGDILVMRMN